MITLAAPAGQRHGWLLAFIATLRVRMKHDTDLLFSSTCALRLLRERASSEAVAL